MQEPSLMQAWSAWAHARALANSCFLLVSPTPPTGKARPALETYWGVSPLDQVSTQPAVRLRQILAHVLCLANLAVIWSRNNLQYSSKAIISLCSNTLY